MPIFVPYTNRCGYCGIHLNQRFAGSAKFPEQIVARFMNSHKKSYRANVALSLSNVNADFLQLILCMVVSHYIINNPLYGAALFLFANIWTLYFEGNLRLMSAKTQRKANVVMWMLLSASVIAGLALVFLYPAKTREPGTNLVSFFVLLIAARSLLTWKINNALSRPGQASRIYKGLFQILFFVPCLAFAWIITDRSVMWTVLVGYAVTGFLLSYQSSTMASLGKYLANSRKDKLRDIFSYRVFSNMSLYAQIALSLGVLMYVCYVCFTTPLFSAQTYVAVGVWIVAVLLFSELFTKLVNRSGWVLSLNLFIVGAAMWIAGSLMIFDMKGFWTSTFWAGAWGFGLACITSVLNRYNGDFKMVARIADRKVSDRDLHFRSMITQIIAVIFSNAIMLCVVTVWVFVIPAAKEPEIPALFRKIMVQLPVVFMLVSLFFALRQPLDERSRQKLMNYTRGTNRNNPTKQNLRSSLVDKKRVKFGVKILAFFVKPFLHLRLCGRENMDMESFPSVFVCNHGIIYGPVAAVIYLPTYFRPWIDRKMVDRDMAAREMYGRFIYRIPLLSRRAKTGIARQLARPVTWALNSFDPIPVEKNSLRHVMSTFDDTVKVLGEGDNVLIFPERPRKVKRGDRETVEHLTDSVGRLFTGFANIGRLYYETTGKSLRFYPLYANRKNHTFNIGEPVVFDPFNEPREEKQRITDLLHLRMVSLAGLPPSVRPEECGEDVSRT